MTILLSLVAACAALALGAILLRDLWRPRLDTGLGLVRRERTERGIPRGRRFGL